MQSDQAAFSPAITTAWVRGTIVYCVVTAVYVLLAVHVNNTPEISGNQRKTGEVFQLHWQT